MSLMQDHVQPEEIGHALEHGFEAGDRLRALIHFGGGCPECRDVFQHLPHDNETTEAPQHADPIAWALTRLWQERTGSPVPVMCMTPIHQAWIERALHEPNAFCRLVIEEAHLLEIEGKRSDPEVVLEQLLVLLSDHRWIRPGDASRRDLHTLAHIYLESVRRRREPDAPRSIEALVKRQLAYGSGDHEIHAVCLLHRARIEGRRTYFDTQAHISQARRHLDRFFEARSSPCHLAEWCYFQAIDHHRQQHYSQAQDAFTKALCGIPDRCIGYRMDVLYNLAALSYYFGDIEGLSRYLPEVETLNAQHGRPDLVSSLAGLRGNLERLRGNEEAAFEALHQALERCLQEGSRLNALQRLRDIHTLYLTHDRIADLPLLRGRFFRILEHKGAAPWKHHQKELVVEWAQEFEIPDLHSVREKLQ